MISDIACGRPQQDIAGEQIEIVVGAVRCVVDGRRVVVTPAPNGAVKSFHICPVRNGPTNSSSPIPLPATSIFDMAARRRRISGAKGACLRPQNSCKGLRGAGT